MTSGDNPPLKGRGSHVNPPNRFALTHSVPDDEHLEFDEDEPGRPETEYLADESKTIVAENDSPDIPFRFSVNPYRGCSHGCAYCYARPTHEYFGLSAGLDFETKVFVKHQAAELLREFLFRPSWKPEPIHFSGVTDCYQPAERRFRLTRNCLEVALEFRQPVTIITKNALVCRDIDLLKQLAALRLVNVAVSVTTLDRALARSMEPRTSSPEGRLSAVRKLADAGVPVFVMVAPVIPGLTDSEMPSILAAAAEAGAAGASYVLLRLPLTVKPVFQEWLARAEPLKKDRVEAAVRGTREGKLNSAEFGRRMSGTGNTAEQIRQIFKLFARKCNLDGGSRSLDCSLFAAPQPSEGQLRLF